MRKIFLQGVALLGAILLARLVAIALASDETRIRWRLEEMAEGFDDTRMDPCLRMFAPDFVDTTSTADRPRVKDALLSLFFTAKDAQTKRFLYALELPEDELKIAVVDGDAPTATVDGLARFHEVHGDARELAWEIRFHGDMEERDGSWMFVRTTHETLRGKRLR